MKAWHHFSTQEEQAQALAQQVVAKLQQAIMQNGKAVLAVSGGQSPVGLFNTLSQSPMPWDKVTVLLVDERLVPSDHPDSNANLVRSHLLQGYAKAAQFTPLVTDTQDEQQVLSHAKQRFQAPTVTILGMGEDGHTASLFPDAPEIQQGVDPQYADSYLIVHPQQAPYVRLSMSLQALKQSTWIALLIQGESKYRVAQKAAQACTKQWPISYLLADGEFDVYWVK